MGTLSYEQWQEVLADAATLGTAYVCFIGGEPTLNPYLADLLDYADSLGLSTEVYSNLTHVSDRLWECSRRNSVNIATSVYSLDATEHDSVTTRRGSHHQTMSNLVKAQNLGLTVRAGAVEVTESQAVHDLAYSLKNDLGIIASVDKHRKLGRIDKGSEAERLDELCGACASASAIVDPDGTVFPCIMSRWLPCGNVNDSSLSEIVRGSLARQQRALKRSFGQRSRSQEPSVADRNSHCQESCNPNGSPGQMSLPTQCMPPCTPTCPPMLQKCPPVDWYCRLMIPAPAPVHRCSVRRTEVPRHVI